MYTRDCLAAGLNEMIERGLSLSAALRCMQITVLFQWLTIIILGDGKVIFREK